MTTTIVSLQLLVGIDRHFNTAVVYCTFYHKIFSHTHYNGWHLSYLPYNYSDNLAKQLYYASRNNRDQEVLELLQRGAPPNNSDYYYTREQRGDTPLHTACANNHLRSAERLIKFGAIVDATDNDVWTPLHWVCLYNRKATAKLLLEHHCPTGEPGCELVQLCMSVQGWCLSSKHSCLGVHSSCHCS